MLVWPECASARGWHRSTQTQEKLITSKGKGNGARCDCLDTGQGLPPALRSTYCATCSSKVRTLTRSATQGGPAQGPGDPMALHTRELGTLAPGGVPADSVDATEELAVIDLPGDALAALHLLRAQFPPLPGRPVAPLVLRSQVYSIVRDRTAADRELDELRCAVQPSG